MMEKYVCEVVPVYVQPQSIVEERACIGIIARCPEAGYAAYRLVTDDEKAVARIVNFFPKFGREKLDRVLDWAAHDIEFAFAEVERRGAAGFVNLIRPRENVLRYGAPQAVITETPASVLDAQYALAIER